EQTDALLAARTAPMLRTQPGDRSMLLAQYQHLLYVQKEPPARLAFNAFLVRWLAEVVSTAELSSTESLPPWLARLLEFIDENVEAPVTVSELSRVAGRSAEHIARCFRSYLQTTPSRMINQARINRAALLLAHTNRSVLDICYSLGYNSASYFYRLFRSSFGIPPHQYRRRYSVYHASGEAGG
ncbi:MAG: helix-turn-helix transcriptional regulator, partial [Spirochaetota bacterium]